MRRVAPLILTALALGTIASAAHADTLTFTLDTTVGTYGGLNPPSPTGPWATATFTQVNDHEVTLDLHALPALGTSFISSWGFNCTDAVSDLTILADPATYVKVAAAYAPYTFYEPPSTPVYDFGFSFNDSTFMITPPYYFGIYYLPEDPTFTFISTTNTISAASFDVDTNTAPYVTEALIKDTNGGVWGASTGATVSVGTSVPTPTAANAGLVLLAGLGLCKFAQRKIGSQKMH